MADVILEGCQTGIVSELIYYSDSCAFYEKYKEEIWDRLYEDADSMGCDSVLHFISTFNGSNDSTVAAVSAYSVETSDDDRAFWNILTWSILPSKNSPDPLEPIVFAFIVK